MDIFAHYPPSVIHFPNLQRTLPSDENSLFLQSRLNEHSLAPEKCNRSRRWNIGRSSQARVTPGKYRRGEEVGAGRESGLDYTDTDLVSTKKGLLYKRYVTFIYGLLPPPHHE